MAPDPLSTPRLEAWLRQTQTPLDLLALFTIWLTVLPFTSATDTGGFTWWVIGRVVLSVIYGIDVFIRARLSTNGLRYVQTHPVALAAVVVPTIRILFSLRLLHSMFRKGALDRFLFVALVLILNGVVMVYTFEENAPGANIHTVGESLWWAAVTVATVGYGDYYPVTIGGRLTAVALMGIGLVTAAVITAQIASTFMDQAAVRRAEAAALDRPPRRRLGSRVRRSEVEAGEVPATTANAEGTPSGGADDGPGPSTDDSSADLAGEALADLDSISERLDRIERLLLARAGDAEPPTGD